jgi:hypothetical protein
MEYLKRLEANGLYEIRIQNFKVGAMLHIARIEKGLTQQELADKAETTNLDC